MSRPDGCDECSVWKSSDGKLHHQPDCPEMFFRHRDGTPDRSKPRGVIPRDRGADREGEPMTKIRSDGAFAIVQERERQITEEGYTAEHDVGHAEELARAGAAYALRPQWDIEANARRRMPPGPPIGWPWDAEYWKPTPDDRIRELVKAGALIAAAIDSLRGADREDVR